MPFPQSAPAAAPPDFPPMDRPRTAKGRTPFILLTKAGHGSGRRQPYFARNIVGTLVDTPCIGNAGNSVFELAVQTNTVYSRAVLVAEADIYLYVNFQNNLVPFSRPTGRVVYRRVRSFVRSFVCPSVTLFENVSKITVRNRLRPAAIVCNVYFRN